MVNVVETEETVTTRELRVNKGLFGRVNNLGTLIIFTTEDSTTETHLLLINLWSRKTSPMMGDPRVFLLMPKPTMTG